MIRAFRWTMVLFAGFLLWMLTGFFSHSLGRPSEPAFTSDKYLAAWYETYNDTYYLGQLPANATVAWADLTSAAQMGRFDGDAESGYLILIDRKENRLDRIARGTLLHEMQHLDCNRRGIADSLDGHGACWHEGMRHLAAKGAFDDIW